MPSLPTSSSSVPVGTLTNYSITVHTSDMPQYMSNAGGFAILHGPSCSSKEVILERHGSTTFQAGVEDTWLTSDMQDLGAIHKLTIGLKEQVTVQCCIACC